MDSDSFHPDDHGMNLDPDSASHDNSSTLFGTTSSSHDDPDMHTGPSTSSQPSSTSRSHLRCFNFGLNVTRIRRHLLKIVEVRNLRKRNNGFDNSRYKCQVTAWCVTHVGLQPGIKQDIHLVHSKNQCFFPGCIETNRLTVPSALCVHLFCEYNYYVPPECRICYYYPASNSWDLLLESIYPIKTFSGARTEDFASLLKDNMHKHLDFENI